MDNIPFYALYGESRPVNELDFVHIESDADRGRNEAASWEIHPHRHENLHQFLYLERGRLQLNLDTVESRREAPCLVSIPPMTVHSLQIAPGSTRYVLTVSEAFLGRLFGASEPVIVERLLARPAAVEVDSSRYPGDQVAPLVMLMYREFCGHADGRVALISAYLKALFVQFGRLVGREAERRWGNQQQASLYHSFRRVVEEHYHQHWEVRRYAELVGVTEDRLNRLCKRAVGHSPSQIIHQRLLMEAKRNLVYTNKTINVVAYELGFTDPNYFSRFFRKYAGETASAFRSRHQESL